MKRSKGFTLIELLVVIAIIGILATVVVVNLSSAQAKARDARRESDIKSMKTAFDLFYLDNGWYPMADANWNTLGKSIRDGKCYNTTGCTIDDRTDSTKFATYLGSWPTDPKSGNSFCFASNSADPGTYTSGQSGYTILAMFEKQIHGAVQGSSVAANAYCPGQADIPGRYICKTGQRMGDLKDAPGGSIVTTTECAGL